MTADPPPVDDNDDAFNLESDKDCIVTVHNTPQTVMATNPPSIPSSKNTFGSAKLPAPQIHFAKLVDTDNFDSVPSVDGNVEHSSTIFIPNSHKLSSSSLLLSLTSCNNNVVSSGRTSLPIIELLLLLLVLSRVPCNEL